MGNRYFWYKNIAMICTEVKDNIMNSVPKDELNVDLLKSCVERAYIFQNYRWKWAKGDDNFLASSYKTKFVTGKDDIEERLELLKKLNPATFGNPDTSKASDDYDPTRNGNKVDTTNESSGDWPGAD